MAKLAGPPGKGNVDFAGLEPISQSCGGCPLPPVNSRSPDKVLGHEAVPLSPIVRTSSSFLFTHCWKYFRSAGTGTEHGAKSAVRLSSVAPIIHRPSALHTARRPAYTPRGLNSLTSSISLAFHT